MEGGYFFDDNVLVDVVIDDFVFDVFSNIVFIVGFSSYV